MKDGHNVIDVFRDAAVVIENKLRRALEAKHVPAPSEYIQGRSVRHIADLRRRYGADFLGNHGAFEKDVLEAIEHVTVT